MTKIWPHAANLRAELTRAGLTQVKVAAILGLYQPEVSYRMKVWQWRPGDLEKIAAHLNIDVELLQPEYRPPARSARPARV